MLDKTTILHADKKLSQFAGLMLREKAVIYAEWREGARKMFSPGHLLTFSGAHFAAQWSAPWKEAG
jgi:hypothetical protein